MAQQLGQISQVDVAVEVQVAVVVADAGGIAGILISGNLATDGNVECNNITGDITIDGNMATGGDVICGDVSGGIDWKVVSR